METTLQITKTGKLTLPPAFQRKLGLNGVDDVLVVAEEREDGFFVKTAPAIPVREIPKEVMDRWIAHDEAEMAELIASGAEL